jgi:Big-like domain-containing protein
MTRIVVLLAAVLAAAAAVQGSQATFTASATNAGSSLTTKSNFPPDVTLTAPAAGATTGSLPTLSGAAGNNSGDSGTVVVTIYSGSSTAGTVVQTRNVTRSAATWTWTLTTALASGTYTAQATQTDSGSQTGTSEAVTFTADATKPTAVSVVAANKTGGTAGRIENGDTITFTYSEAITAASVWSTWGGSSTSVKVRFTGSGNDTFTVLDMSSLANINLGSVATNGDYVSSATTFTSTMVRSADATKIVVTLGTPSNVQTTPNVGRNMSWAVGANIKDLVGNTITTPATYNETDSGVDF